jgi:hypothetical protein
MTNVPVVTSGIKADHGETPVKEERVKVAAYLPHLPSVAPSLHIVRLLMPVKTDAD